MAVSRDDVKHVASLARLAITDDQVDKLTAELNGILGHMDVLAKVETKLEPVAGIGAESAPLAADRGPSVSLARPLEEIAPSVRDGFFLVPRLATHETTEES
jgi:aspartyl-tRNA(Asn)/glutamyl-tRNA(Gln) amidotransferase subunit C